jgi:hypothetical protein
MVRSANGMIAKAPFDPDLPPWRLSALPIRQAASISAAVCASASLIAHSPARPTGSWHQICLKQSGDASPAKVQTHYCHARDDHCEWFT